MFLIDPIETLACLPHVMSWPVACALFYVVIVVQVQADGGEEEEGGDAAAQESAEVK